MKKILEHKTAIVIIALAIAVVSILGGAFALFSSNDTTTATAKAGTVKLEPVKIGLGTSGNMSDKITNWNPGDITDIKWDVTNKGNKSIVTRNTVLMFWDSDFSEYANQDETIYLYQGNISNSDITAEMLNKKPEKNINIGTPTEKFTIDGKEYVGYKYTVENANKEPYGDTLDGVGVGAETGDAKEVGYNYDLYDDKSTTTDTIAFKLAFSNWANVHTQDKNLRIFVLTEAMQARNTNNDSWEQISLTEIKLDDKK